MQNDIQQESKKAKLSLNSQSSDLQERIETLEKCLAHMAAMNGTSGILELYNIKKFKVQ